MTHSAFDKEKFYNDIVLYNTPLPTDPLKFHAT